MQATDRPPGLRERKKIKTRQAIRREAFRLFDAPSKESLLLACESTMAALSDQQSECENTRLRLIFSIPELKAALYEEYYRTVMPRPSATESTVPQTISRSGCSSARSWAR